jgi:predicted glycosyltransferase
VSSGENIRLIAGRTHPYSSNLTGGNRSHAVLTHCQTEKPKEIIVTKSSPLGEKIEVNPRIESIRNEITAKLLALGYTHTEDPEIVE